MFGGAAVAAEMEIADFVALAAVGKDVAAVVAAAASTVGMLLVAVEV